MFAQFWIHEVVKVVKLQRRGYIYSKKVMVSIPVLFLNVLCDMRKTVPFSQFYLEDWRVQNICDPQN
jgi:hypothetical protein